MRTATLSSLGLAALLALTACSDQVMSEARAERLCRDEARLADGFAGNVGVAGGTGGARAGGSITISNNILRPRDEAAVMESCIARRMAGRGGPGGFRLTVSGAT
ncbi:hypothetical protein HKCCE2091_13890 [Rhodobacterales bacterium HKCCE2091]|nr:hypothetical protein [Rhodobacterales bacterium HKCCE2091]